MSGQDIRAALGKNIKFFRFHKQYSQADLAEKSDISIAYLSKIERGIMYPKPDVLSRIAESLGVEIYELFKTKPSIDAAPNDSEKVLNRLSKDMTRRINQAMEEVFTQYLK